MRAVDRLLHGMQTVALFKPHHTAASEAAAIEIMRSGQIASGPKVTEFQNALANWTSHSPVVSTDDMSGAMLLALRLCGVGSGDEVLTSAYTCLSSASPIANLGARPRWVDVDADTGLLDPEVLAERITPRTRACVVYHAAGYPARMPAIAALCRKHGIALIEDCNNAFGARLHGKPLGYWGDAAVYSFYPNRQINAAEGGAVSFRDASLVDAALRLRRFGIPTSGFRDAMGEIDPRCDVPAIGWSAAMSQLNAALGLAQLPGLEQRLSATRANAAALTARLSVVPGIRVVAPTTGADPVYWGLLALTEHRDTVLAELKRRGVMASKLHHRLDSYSGFAAEPVRLSGTTVFMDRVIALPCGHWLQSEELDHVAEVVEESIRSARAVA